MCLAREKRLVHGSGGLKYRITKVHMKVSGSINSLDVLAVYWDECCTTSVV